MEVVKGGDRRRREAMKGGVGYGNFMVVIYIYVMHVIVLMNE